MSNSGALQYSQEVINRVSFLRKDTQFIEEALSHQEARFIPFDSYYPFIDENGRILRMYRGELEETIRESIASENLVFLGLLLGANSSFSYRSKYKGTPMFALDVTSKPSALTCISKQAAYKKAESFRDFNRLSVEESSIVSHARMYLQWLHTHRFCSICGSRNNVVFAGSQLQCSNTECVSNKSVSNVCFPRTDAVAISAVTNRDFSKVLVCKSGAPRNKERKLFSCVSGFVEPSETIEVAVAREVWEETGLHVKHVEVLMSQPWPFPNNLMIGCVAIADENEPTDLTHDCELDEVRWVPSSTLKRLLNTPESISGFIQDEQTGLNLPNKKTIAHMLMETVVNRYDNHSSE
ncbi:LAFE_0C04566g1_1 [Lachancea fermentati]|uniref:NAD(+) diphosphatase n=1 Tax=Lachancea fermentati TaxID=4955 RepID=A0A1G4M9S4_LACFM|nr:LAFE_0C04566g1_1 [Lachancea fermentati]